MTADCQSFWIWFVVGWVALVNLAAFVCGVLLCRTRSRRKDRDYFRRTYGR